MPEEIYTEERREEKRRVRREGRKETTKERKISKETGIGNRPQKQ